MLERKWSSVEACSTETCTEVGLVAKRSTHDWDPSPQSLVVVGLHHCTFSCAHKDAQMKLEFCRVCSEMDQMQPWSHT